MKSISIYTDLTDVTTILENFDLSIEELQEVAHANYLKQIECTENDSPTAAGSIGYFASVRTLRELLTPKGWMRTNFKNSPRIVSELLKMSIVVSGGDGNTGNPFAIPQTKSTKGSTIRTAIMQNNGAELLFPEEEIPQVMPVSNIGHSSKSVWMFLVHIHLDNRSETMQHIIRCELSLPIGIRDSGYVSAWSERIIIPEIIIDPNASSEESDDFAPEQEIKITRK